jgi:pilus assembly protein CpaE
MNHRALVPLLTDETETERAVAAALVSSGRLAPGPVCRVISELVARLESEPAPLVLVDIDREPKRILKEIDPVIGRFSGTRFVVISKEMRSDLVLDAMQAGARHFVLKGSIPAELTSVLDGLVVLNGTSKHGAHRGSAVTVLSASGGAGATTIAVNLAGELQLMSSEPALVVDLDQAYGAVAAYLGLRGQYGIADVLSAGSRIDRELVATTTVVHAQDIHVLMSPSSTNFASPAPLHFEHLEQALRACRDAYRHTVVDAPRVTLDAAATLAHASDITLLVLQLTVKDVRVAREMLTQLAARGISADRILPVANRYRKRSHMLTLDEAQRALGVPPIVITNDFKSAINAINFGQLLAQAARRSALREDLRKLAQRVAEAHAPAKTTKAR